jgi:peptide/nickel transport system substrate-binding protein
MPEDSNYWDKFWQKRYSRRRLLSGTAVAGTGLAIGAVVGCGSDTSDPNKTDAPTGSGNGNSSLYCGEDATPGEKYLCQTFDTPVDGRKTFVPAPADSRGGFLTYIGFDAVVLDRYDPHQTQFGPMYSNQSAVFSKLYRYGSHEEPTWDNILPDLATGAPEMIEPDTPLTYIVKLNQGVKFHDTPKIRSNFPDLAGRELTAEDVAYSYNRQRDADSYQRTYYYRSSQYNTIDKLEVVDKYTLKITTKEPTAPFYHFMADTNSMIIPKEIVDLEPGPDGSTPWDSIDSYRNRAPVASDRMIGTGPFMWDTLTFGIEYKAVRNPEWFGWDDKSLGRPYLDGYKATGQGLNDATVESLFRRKEIDGAGFIDNPQWILNILDEIPELDFRRQQVSGWLNSRLKLYAKPFDDPRVRRALHLATDRQEIVDIIGSGAWVKVGPVNSAIKYWALPDEELLSLPGYRLGAERDQDIAEARALFEAAGKPDLPQIWFADVPGYIARYAPTYIETIKRNLGTDQDIKFQTVPYSRIAEGYVSPEADTGAFSWGFDNGWIDLDDWVYPYFKKDGPKNSFHADDPVLNTLLDDSRREFDTTKRKEIGYKIQRHLLGVTDPNAPAAHARIDYACPGGGAVNWPYAKNGTSWPWFGNQYWVAEAWFDHSDPSFAGRKGD